MGGIGIGIDIGGITIPPAILIETQLIEFEWNG